MKDFDMCSEVPRGNRFEKEEVCLDIKFVCKSSLKRRRCIWILSLFVKVF